MELDNRSMFSNFWASNNISSSNDQLFFHRQETATPPMNPLASGNQLFTSGTRMNYFNLPNNCFTSSGNNFSQSFHDREFYNFVQPVPGSTKEKFIPPVTEDLIVKDGLTTMVPCRQQRITAMPAYADKSFEEIRMEDYIIGRSLPIPQKCKSSDNPFRNISFMNTLLQNAFIEYDQDLINNFNDNGTSTLLQKLLESIKNKFNLNSISNEAKKKCEKLTLELIELSEKTKDELTAVILEDMLDNVRKRQFNSSTSQPEGNNLCPTNQLKSLAKKCIAKKEKHINFKNGKEKIMEQEYRMDSENFGQDVVDISIKQQQEQLCESTDKYIGRGKKSGYLSTDNKDSLRRFRPSHQISFKHNRHLTCHLKELSKKRECKCDSIGGEESVDNIRTSSEISPANSEEFFKKPPRSKSKIITRYKRRKNRKLIDASINEHCVCELLKKVSVNDVNIKSNSKKGKSTCQKELVEDVSSSEDEDINHLDCSKKERNTLRKEVVENICSDSGDDIIYRDIVKKGSHGRRKIPVEGLRSHSDEDKVVYRDMSKKDRNLRRKEPLEGICSDSDDYIVHKDMPKPDKNVRRKEPLKNIGSDPDNDIILRDTSKKYRHTRRKKRIQNYFPDSNDDGIVHKEFSKKERNNCRKGPLSGNTTVHDDKNSEDVNHKTLDHQRSITEEIVTNKCYFEADEVHWSSDISSV